MAQKQIYMLCCYCGNEVYIDRASLALGESEAFVTKCPYCEDTYCDICFRMHPCGNM